jgi:hypothetical protein
LYFLFTHNCVAAHDSNTIIKCDDKAAVVGLITDDDETAYREVRDLAVWCQNNNLSPNVSPTKEPIVDYKKQGPEHVPIHINRAVMERIVSFKFLGVHITKDLSWSTHNNSHEKG